jgi:hypothetical protein
MACAECMRVTVSHNSRKEEIMRSVDRSFDDLFKGLGTVPLQIVNELRKWTGSRMDFSFDAKVGIVSTPILSSHPKSASTVSTSSKIVTH